jgi:hypothetical protein
MTNTAGFDMATPIRLWISFAIATVVAIAVASIVWISDHPIGTNWDETMYFNQLLSDVDRIELASGVGRKLFALAAVAGGHDRQRPPAFRLLVLPFTYTLGFSSTTVRMVSIAFLLATLGLTYLTVRRIASPASAAFGVVFLALCPGIIFENMTFGTEYPLILATSGMLYFLFSNWNTGKESTATSIWLGISLGLGALSKATFLLIGAPTLLVALILSAAKKIASPSPRWLITSGVVGTAIALPWWAANFKPAVELASSARNFVRHSLGATSLDTLAEWLELFAQNAMGFAVSIVSLLLLATWIIKVSTRRMQMDVTQKTVLLICFLCPVPVLLLHLSGENQNLMHITPLLPFLAVGFAVLADSIKWESIPYFSAVIAVLLAIQLVITLLPLATRDVLPIDPPYTSGRPPWHVMARMDQWDWSPVRSLATALHIDRPSIAYLGHARTFNPPSLAYPWAAHHEPSPDVMWLWRYEDGPIDWEKVTVSARQSDIVLTAPRYIGLRTDKQDIDNQHNAEFAQRLSHDSVFCGPIPFKMGRFAPVEVLAFVNERAAKGTCDQLH